MSWHLTSVTTTSHTPQWLHHSIVNTQCAYVSYYQNISPVISTWQKPTCVTPQGPGVSVTRWSDSTLSTMIISDSDILKPHANKLEHLIREFLWQHSNKSSQQTLYLLWTHSTEQMMYVNSYTNYDCKTTCSYFPPTLHHDIWTTDEKLITYGMKILR